MVKLFLATVLAVALPLGMAAIADDHHGGPGGGGGFHDHEHGWHGDEHHGDWERHEWHHGDRDEGVEDDWHREDNCWRWIGFAWIRVC